MRAYVWPNCMCSWLHRQNFRFTRRKNSARFTRPKCLPKRASLRQTDLGERGIQLFVVLFCFSPVFDMPVAVLAKWLGV